MRVAALLPLLFAGACSDAPAQPQAAPGAVRVECALGEGSQFGPDCLIEKVAGEQGSEFVVRHPDGGFRRFRIAEDRSGMVALDGADTAVNELVGEPKVLQVTVGADRYRFPADLDASQ
jgi:hypothetical protein